MKTYSPFLLLLVMTLCFAACEDDSDAGPEQTCALLDFTLGQKTGEHLRYENVYTADTVITSTNVYSGSNGQESLFVTTDITYSANGKIAEMKAYRRSGTQYNPLSLTFEYDEKGRMVRQISKVGENNTVLTYNDAGQAIKITFLRDLAGKDTSAYYLNTFNASGNVVRQELYSDNGSGAVVKYSTTELVYDNHNNPMHGYYYDYAEEPIGLLSVNNIVKKTTRFAASAEVNVENFSYTYNSDGYPVSRTSDLTSDNAMTYTYQCKAE